jgi:hypothetical protein
MMVVLAIIVIVTVIALMGQDSFNRSILLTDTAYTIAFSVREAQGLGLSSRVTGGGVANAGYGIYLSSATPNAYIFFSDTIPSAPGNDLGGACPGHTQTSGPDVHPGNCLYDSGELIRTYTLNRGYQIYRFCGTTNSGNTTECSGTDFDSMYITFMRPSTDSVIFSRNGGDAPELLTSAKIYLRSPNGNAERCILVSKVGQIAVSTCD